MVCLSPTVPSRDIYGTVSLSLLSCPRRTALATRWCLGGLAVYPSLFECFRNFLPRGDVQRRQPLLLLAEEVHKALDKGGFAKSVLLNTLDLPARACSRGWQRLIRSAPTCSFPSTTIPSPIPQGGVGFRSATERLQRPLPGLFSVRICRQPTVRCEPPLRAHTWARTQDARSRLHAS